MPNTYDTYCIDAVDLEAARDCLERTLSIKLILHESMFWGGGYYRAACDAFEELTVRRNYNSFTNRLNERDFPDCAMVVTISCPVDPSALEARLVVAGLRLLHRAVV